MMNLLWSSKTKWNNNDDPWFFPPVKYFNFNRLWFIVHSTYGWIYGYLWFISMLNLVLALYVHTHQHWRRCERFEILIMTWDQSRKILNSMPNMMLVGMMNQFTILMMVDWWILSTVLRTIGLSKDLITNSTPQYKRKLVFDEIKNELEFDFIR